MKQASNQPFSNSIFSMSREYSFNKVKIVFILQFTFLILYLTFPQRGLGGFCYAQPLTPSAKVSLITVGPGQPLYSSFGHSAFWISDPMQGIDKVYNYGTFDFRTEGFYLKFLRGTLPYHLSVAPMYYTLYGAQAENRRVTEQILNLSNAQKQRLFDFLENNYLPQNRQYAYKFFYDNCSTRLRDALKAACGDSLQYFNQPINGTREVRSFRSWMNLYLGDKDWARFGMNLALGLPADQTATPQQEMYLPNNLMKHFDKAEVGGKPLVTIKTSLFEPPAVNPYRKSFLDLLTSPQSIFTALIILALLPFWIKRSPSYTQKPSFLVAKIFFGLIGLAGWILLLLGIATDHGVTAWNPDLLWAVPFHLPLMLFLGNSKHAAWLKKYVAICLWAAIAVFVIGIVGFFWQKAEWVSIRDGGLLIACVIVMLAHLNKRLSNRQV